MILMNSFIESSVINDKDEYFDKRVFLVCDYYCCSSFLPYLENDKYDCIHNFPVCNEKI